MCVSFENNISATFISLVQLWRSNVHLRKKDIKFHRSHTKTNIDSSWLTKKNPFAKHQIDCDFGSTCSTFLILPFEKCESHDSNSVSKDLIYLRVIPFFNSSASFETTEVTFYDSKARFCQCMAENRVQDYLQKMYQDFDALYLV